MSGYKDSIIEYQDLTLRIRELREKLRELGNFPLHMRNKARSEQWIRQIPIRREIQDVKMKMNKLAQQHKLVLVYHPDLKCWVLDN